MIGGRACCIKVLDRNRALSAWRKREREREREREIER
jgi:hypothetical protein